MPDGEMATPAPQDERTTDRDGDELVVRYRYGEGILLEGDTYPHKGAIKKAVPRWRWFRSLRTWGVTSSRDKAMTEAAVQRYADGLTKAGIPAVRVDYEAPKPEDVRPAAEVFAERQRRSRQRAERAEQRATKLEQKAESHYQASRDATRGIPMGQPILLGHHSQRRHERAVERANASMGRAVQAQKEAKQAHARARASEAQAERRESPAFAIRRLGELNAEARELIVKITGETPPDWRGLHPRGPATGDYLAMLQTRQREVHERIGYFTSLLEEGHVLATEQAPRPMELVMTDRGPATTVKTTEKMVRIKRGGRMVSVARNRVWVPRSILALRSEYPLTRDEAHVLWRAQHHKKVEISSIEQRVAVDSLVDRGLLVPHPDAIKAGIFLPTNRGNAFELPEGKPKTWLSRWDGLRATPVSSSPDKSAPGPKRRWASPKDADRFAKKLGLTPSRTPTIGQMRDVMVQAVREGLGPQMKAWFVRSTRSALGDIDAAFGYARGVVALEQGGWPPDPLRGKTYGEEHFRGLIHSLEHLPEVVELLEEAASWRGKMRDLTGDRQGHWFDDARMATLARRIMSDLHHQRVGRKSQARDRTPEGARELREWVRSAALRNLERLRIPLDPSLYDPNSDPQVVYRTLCEVDSEAARQVLEEVFGIEFQPGSDGSHDAILLCDDRKTLEEIRTKAAARAAANAKKDAKQAAERRKDAEALLRVANDAAKRGPITSRRFNHAYGRLHPEAKGKRRALKVQRKGQRTEASVHGPSDQFFFVSVDGDGETAIVALLQLLIETAGESVSTATKGDTVESAAAKPETSTPRTTKKDATQATKKGRARSATSKRPRSGSSTKKGSNAANRRAEAGSTERTVPSSPKAEPAANNDPPPSSTPAPPERAPGSLWSVEQEGFALVSPRGEGQRVQVPTAVQSALLDVGKPDREAMERIRERELAERRGPAKAEPAAPLLEASEHPAEPEPELPAEPEPELPAEPEPERLAEPETEHPAEHELPAAPEGPAEPTARLEYVDVATGTPTDPDELGTLSTGRVVAEIDGEMVEIDEEDLLGHGSDPDPRKRRYRFDVDSPADYPGQAQAIKAARNEKKTSTKSRANAKAGLRSTFDSASKAAALFYEHNADFFDHVHDPWDGLRDWMDGIEVRVGRGKSHRKLARTATGKRILGQRHAAVAIRQALAYLMGKAKGRRWEDVPWDQVDRLGEALHRYYEAPDREAGQPGIYWRPFTGTVRAEDLDAMTPEQREAIRAQEAAQEIGEQLEQLREAYARAKKCLPKDVRSVIERRIVEWTRWVKEPTEIPGYACEPDPATAGYLCNYPSVAGELAQLRRSCEDAYDPNWAAEPSKQGAAGFPDTSGGEDERPRARAISARRCCSKTLETSAPTRAARPPPAKDPPLASEGTRAKRKATKAGPAPPRRSKAAGGKAKACKAKPPAGKAKACKAKPPTGKAKTPRSPAARRRDAKVRAAQRRADRLACSADAARHQAETIDTDSYRARLQSAKEAVKDAEHTVSTRCKAFDTAKTQHAAARADPEAGPKELAHARRRIREARCQLQLARSALVQRRRDHKRATTELRKAEQRVKSRKAVADKRARIAKQAKAKAETLARSA